MHLYENMLLMYDFTEIIVSKLISFVAGFRGF